MNKNAERVPMLVLCYYITVLVILVILVILVVLVILVILVVLVVLVVLWNTAASELRALVVFQTYGIHHKRQNELEFLTYVDYVDRSGPAYLAGLRSGERETDASGLSN